MSEAQGFFLGLEASLSSFPQLTALAASSAVAAVAMGFVLKLARDFVSDKRRQAASLRIVAV